MIEIDFVLKTSFQLSTKLNFLILALIAGNDFYQYLLRNAFNLTRTEIIQNSFSIIIFIVAL